MAGCVDRSSVAGQEATAQELAPFRAG